MIIKYNTKYNTSLLLRYKKYNTILDYYYVIKNTIQNKNNLHDYKNTIK